MRFPGPKDEAWKYTRAEWFVRGVEVPEEGKGKSKGKGLLGEGGFVELLDEVADEQVIEVASGEERAVRVAHVAEAGRLVARRLVVEVAEGANVVLVEGSSGPRGLLVAGTELRLAAGASVHYLRTVEDPVHVGLVGASLADGARLRITSLALGADLARIEVTARIEGAAEVELAGLTLARGEQHVDHHVTVDHAVPRGTSRQVFRSLVADRARSVFTGRVIVRPGAGGTDAAQVHRALLLSERAIATARPQLEIHADDVKCSHGTAVGALDPESMFYLRQRGLDPAQARSLLVVAFASEVLATVPPAERAALEARVGAWLVAA